MLRSIKKQLTQRNNSNNHDRRDIQTKCFKLACSEVLVLTKTADATDFHYFWIHKSISLSEAIIVMAGILCSFLEFVLSCFLSLSFF